MSEGNEEIGNMILTESRKESVNTEIKMLFRMDDSGSFQIIVESSNNGKYGICRLRPMPWES